MIFQPGQLILNNKYRVEKLIGQGAYAEVYLATHVDLGVPRAVKALRADAPGVGSTVLGDYRQRFRLEFQLAARLDHPNVIKVHDLVEEEKAIYAVLEYAPGGSVADLLREGGPLPIDQAVRLACDVAEGLGAIHALDAVHRDVKPSNILLHGQGRALVADLGLVQMRDTSSGRSTEGSVAPPHPGTPAYMSPEQESARGLLLPASDVYALGLVVFELLTGKLYRGLRPGASIRALRADVPRWLDDLLARMLSQDPRERPWDGKEAAALVRQELARLEKRGEKGAGGKRVKPAVFFTPLVLALALYAAGLALSWWTLPGVDGPPSAAVTEPGPASGPAEKSAAPRPASAAVPALAAAKPNGLAPSASGEAALPGADAPVEAPTRGEIWVRADAVANLRRQPTTKAGLIRTLEPGAEVEILGIEEGEVVPEIDPVENRWYRVKYQGSEGYVYFILIWPKE